MLGIFVIVIMIIILIYAIASEICRGRLHDKIYSLEGEKNVREQEMDDLKARYRSIEKKALEADAKYDLMLKTFTVEKLDFRKCLDSIAHQYTVTNKNKMKLMTFLFYTLAIKNKSIYDLKTNKLSPAENAKFLIDHLYHHTSSFNEDESNDILNALLTLILYNRKK